MTLRTAVSFFAHTRPEADIVDVVRILCGLAAMADALGDYRSRDDSIEAAAELLRAQPATPVRMRRVF